MKNIFKSFVVLISIVMLTSCLTMEKKEYKYEILKDGKVRLTINYYNIVSQDDEEKNVSFKDFGELVTDYLEGDKVLDNYPGATVVSKELFEKDGALCAKAVIEFPNLETAKIVQYKGKGPYMYYMGGFSETYKESNGEHGGDSFPVIFWEETKKELTISTVVTEDVSAARSLLGHYKTWKENQ